MVHVPRPSTLWTQAGRLVAKGLSYIMSPESVSMFHIAAHPVYVPDLPDEFESFRIVQLSDIHFYEYGCNDYYQRVVETVNGLKPDMIVTTGDTIHYGEEYLPLAESFLKQLKAPYGKWGCMGNHDYSDDYQGQALQHMKFTSGFNMLVNEAIPIEKEGKRFWLSGVDDYILGRPDLQKAYACIEPDKTHVSLGHNPNLAPHMVKEINRPDVILAGHTHGGQIGHPLVHWVHTHLFHQPYQYGWYDFDVTRLYVTSGIGSATVAVHTPAFDFALYPFRINTTAEIVVFELTSQPDSVGVILERPESVMESLHVIPDSTPDQTVQSRIVWDPTDTVPEKRR